MTDEKIAKIRELNDFLRTTFTGGRAVFAGALAHSDLVEQSAVMDEVRKFSDFNNANDPHGEHDFGRFAIGEQSYIWKIDYYALDEMSGSEHPEDPNVTVRVLSVFYAEDY